MQNLELKTTDFGEIWDTIKILSTHNLIMSKTRSGLSENYSAVLAGI